MRGRRLRLRFSDVIALLALFIALGGGAYAAVGNPFIGSGGKIQGCVSTSGGLSVVKAGRRCAKHTTALAFNQRGPRGAAGPKGAAGSPGTAGTAGAAGHNGAVGATGPTGANGATAGYSASIGLGGTGASGTTGLTSVDFTGATGAAKPIVTESLPAGNYVVNGKVDVTMTDTGTGGTALIHCGMTDSPVTGSVIVGDTSDLTGVLDYPLTTVSGTKYISVGTIPLTLATNTGGLASTVEIDCGVLNAGAGAGTLDIAAANASITAVQTSHNN